MPRVSMMVSVLLVCGFVVFSGCPSGPPCETNADCTADGTICRDGKCAPGCIDDSACDKGQSCQSGHGGNADMAFRRVVAVMPIEIVGLCRARIDRPRKAGATTIEHEPRGVSRRAGREHRNRGVACDPARVHRRGGGADPDRVEEQQRCTRQALLRHVVKGCIENEGGDPRHGRIGIRIPNGFGSVDVHFAPP